MNSGPNPLPKDEVGPRLLVELQAERLIERLKLKENFEEEGGWEYGDLCRIVARELGVEWAAECGGSMLVSDLTPAKAGELGKVFKELASWSKWVEVDEEGAPLEGGKLHLEVMLMMGLGTRVIPIDPKASPDGGLAERACQLFGCRIGCITSKTFENPKREVKRLYALHAGKQQRREKFANERSVEEESSQSSNRGSTPIAQLVSKVQMASILPIDKKSDAMYDSFRAVQIRKKKRGMSGDSMPDRSQGSADGD